MNYLVSVARGVSSDSRSEYHGVKLVGNNQFFEDVEKCSVESNPRLGFLNSCKYAVSRVASLLEYGAIPPNKVIFQIHTRLYYRYLAYCMHKDDGAKPPKEYLLLVYEIYNMLEALPCGYDITFTPWDTAVNSIVNDSYWLSRNKGAQSRAVDIFKDM